MTSAQRNINSTSKPHTTRNSPSCLFWSIRELIDTGEGGGGAGDDVGDTGDMVR